MTAKRLSMLQIDPAYALRSAQDAVSVRRTAGHQVDTRVRTLRCALPACARALDARKVRATACKEETMSTRRSPDALSPADASPLTDSSTRRPPRSRKSPEPPTLRARVTAETRRALIAEAAYLRAERRGFSPGQETDDWLAAEAEVDALLKAGQSPPQ
jgi:hypothetical protein